MIPQKPAQALIHGATNGHNSREWATRCQQIPNSAPHVLAPWAGDFNTSATTNDIVIQYLKESWVWWVHKEMAHLDYLFWNHKQIDHDPVQETPAEFLVRFTLTEGLST